LNLVDQVRQIQSSGKPMSFSARAMVAASEHMAKCVARNEWNQADEALHCQGIAVAHIG